ncbi:hypothetical protein T459_12578 [Capsicum annuum]|uniref:Uncharacterized protein n=1 Tax=Capsicum annuum TaxID=4072 RepID=A0A2G2ZQA6_CAPAN|nr:hypothetical protein T459_12578 [Capsicum annuum]
MEATSAVLVTHSGFNSITPANSPADSVRTVSNSGKGELGSSSSLSWDFDEKENESKAAKLKSSGKGSKNFMSPTISTSSKIAQSPKKKILVERNDPVRTSITLSDGKATFFSVNSEEHNQNSENVMEPKETIPVDEIGDAGGNENGVGRGIQPSGVAKALYSALRISALNSTEIGLDHVPVSDFVFSKVMEITNDGESSATRVFGSRDRLDIFEDFGFWFVKIYGDN